MLNRIIQWIKARWTWERGYCPTCGKYFFNQPAVYNTECEICDATNDDLTIWSRWRNWKPKNPESSVKVLHSNKIKTHWNNNQDEAIIKRE